MNVKFLKLSCLIALGFLFTNCSKLLKKNETTTYEVEAVETPSNETEEEWDLDFDKPWAGKAEPKVATDNAEESPFTKNFEKDTELDGLLVKQPIQVALQEKPKESATSPMAIAPQPKKEQASSSNYRIQLLTVAEFETAQAKRRAFSSQIGANVDIFFDAPFYKLRFGYFKSKREADEKLLDLMDMGLQGFVIKE